MSKDHKVVFQNLTISATDILTINDLLEPSGYKIRFSGKRFTMAVGEDLTVNNATLTIVALQDLL